MRPVASGKSGTNFGFERILANLMNLVWFSVFKFLNEGTETMIGTSKPPHELGPFLKGLASYGARPSHGSVLLSPLLY